MDANSIIQAILEMYDQEIEDDKRIAALLEKITGGKGAYPDASELASRSGRHAGKSIASCLTAVTGNGPVSKELASAVLPPSLRHNYKLVSRITETLQRNLNASAGIGLNPVVPEMDTDRVEGLITEISRKEDFSDFSGTFEQQVENLSMSIVDDFVRENAELHYQVGRSPMIHRIAAAGCCNWCNSIAGSYEYAEVNNTGNDVFRRHSNCRCQIVYDPAEKGSRMQDVHSKRLLSAEESEKIEARMNYGLRNTSYWKDAAFNSKADPMADAFGRGIDSNPNEINAFRQECKELGVKIIERDNESLNYQPANRIGFPGQLSVSKDASYGAWCHEMQHMRDDRDSGWDGALKVWDRDVHAMREEIAYGIEIRMALDAGRPDIAERLRKNLEEERRRIYAAE